MTGLMHGAEQKAHCRPLPDHGGMADPSFGQTIDHRKQENKAEMQASLISPRRLVSCMKTAPFRRRYRFQHGSVISMSSSLHAVLSGAAYRARVRHPADGFRAADNGPRMGNGFHCRNSDSGEKDEGVLQLVEENLLPFKGLIKMPVMLIFAGLHLALHLLQPAVKVIRAVSESAIPGAELYANTTRMRSRHRLSG